ncbi:DUF4157 domain-containing protein [Archangium lansingense]|uniref:eCIS core domain-containing protein n=1 Tax=Archangium lansingense TaxID=2995310 RepID=UPI003B79C8FC
MKVPADKGQGAAGKAEHGTPKLGDPRQAAVEREKLRSILSGAPGFAGALDAPGSPLDPATRGAMESAFGQDFGDVRVHTSASAGAMADGLGANALTVGSDIAFAAGRYRPGVPEGERLIAHELAHVVQQRLGGSRGPALSADTPGTVSSPSEPHEREADRAASLVVLSGHVPRLTPSTGRIQLQQQGDTAQDVESYPVRPAAEGDRALIDEGQRFFDRTREALGNPVEGRPPCLVVGTGLTWYDGNGNKVDAYVLREGATLWGPGWYLAGPDWTLRLHESLGELIWRHTTFESESVGWLFNWLTPADSQRFQQAKLPPVFLVAIPETAVSRGGQFKGTGWAKPLVDQVRKLLEARASGGDKAPLDPATQRRIPDKLVEWSNERGAYVNVWVDGAHESLLLSDEESAEDLEKRVEDAAERVRNARDPSQSTRMAGGARTTGFVGRSEQDVPLEGARHIANRPAYPSNIINYGGDITVTGATNRFKMQLNYSPAGAGLLSQVAARGQRIRYNWELLDVTNVKPDALGAVARVAPGSGERISPMQGEKMAAKQKLGHTLEDLEADVLSGPASQVLVTWPARSAWLSVVGISTVVQVVGTPISTFISTVTTPYNEQRIGFSKEGEFLIRCIATPAHEEGDVIARASSVAVVAVKVQNINARAADVNQRSFAELRKLEEELGKVKGDERTRIEARIKALRRVETGTAAELGRDALELVDKRLAVVDQLEAANKAGTPRDDRPWELRLLAAQLELQSIPLSDYRASLVAQKAQLGARLSLIEKATSQMPYGNYRPHATLVSEETGQVNELILVLGEAKDSTKGSRHYLLADVTAPTPSARYVYEGTSGKPGLAGHSEAVKQAFIDFSRENGYGRGTISLRMPALLEEAVEGKLDVPDQMHSAPGSRARALQRLKDLATAAEIAGLFVTGPAGLAIGALGAVAGAIVAAESLTSRHAAGALKWDFQTVMDVSSIVGGAAGVAGAGLGALQKLPKWASHVERTQRALHIFGVTQMGASVIIVPYELEQHLREIENTPGLSEGMKAARRAEAILGALRSGMMTVVSAAQMLETPGETATPRRAAEHEGPRKTVEAPGAPAGPAHEGKAAGAAGEPAAPAVVREGPVPEGAATKPRPVTLEAPPEIREGLPPDLRARIPVEVAVGDSSTTVRVNYTVDEKGVVTDIRIRAGEGASARDIELHTRTVRLMERYSGFSGQVRNYIERIGSFITGNARAVPGTRAWEAKLELDKLPDIIKDRAQRLTDSDAKDVELRAHLEEELRLLEAQLAEHGRILAKMELTPGLGFVAAEGVSTGAQKAKEFGYLDAPAEYFWRWRNDRLELVSRGEAPKLKYEPSGKEPATPGKFVEDTGAREEPSFIKGATKAEAFEVFGGNNPETEFGRYVKMLLAEGIAPSVTEIRDAMQPPGTRTYRTVRHNLKQKFIDAVMERLINPQRLEQTATYRSVLKSTKSPEQALKAASHTEMLRLTRDLASADKGSIAERWYMEMYGKARGGETQVSISKEQAKALNVELLENRRIDVVEGDTIRELKNVSGPLGKRERDQVMDLLKLVGKRLPRKGGETDTIARVNETILDPRGALANAAWMYVMLAPAAKRPLQFEIYNSRGESMIITSANRDILADAARLSTRLGLPQKEGG